MPPFLLPLHEGHEVASEEGEVEDADLLGEGDDDLLLGREGFHVVTRDDHRHALSERPPNALVRILQIPVIWKEVTNGPSRSSFLALKYG